ncbi:MAG: RNase adapter RapZ [Myxococcota bacterium]
MEAPLLVVVSGLSGAGRSTAMKALEDIGFYCVDNLPVVLLERFVELFSGGASQVAVVIDVREREFLEAFPEVYGRLLERGTVADLLFLEASDEVLERRFDETRRIHPAGGGCPLRESIAKERDILAPIMAHADSVVDTTLMSVHELKRLVTRRYTGDSRSGPVDLELVSFGFRYGAPEVVDLMIDVRFLPNPNFEPDLRERTGLDPEVARFVLEQGPAGALLDRLLDFLQFLIPLYEEEGKAYLTIAIGCTGGQHRSVTVVEALAERLEAHDLKSRVRHRDVDRRIEP